MVVNSLMPVAAAFGLSGGDDDEEGASVELGGDDDDEEEDSTSDCKATVANVLGGMKARY